MRPDERHGITGLPPPGEFARIASALSLTRSPAAAVHRILELAVVTVDAADHAGILCFDRREIEEPVGSGPVGGRLIELQLAAGEGPCLDVREERTVVEAPDLGVETRWPTFAADVLEQTEVRSLLAVPLLVDDRVRAALLLAADRSDAFGTDERDTASVFAVHAATALDARITEAQLLRGLRSRDLIGQAKGILMAEQAIDSETAFERLRMASQHTNHKLRDIAARVVAAAERGAVVLPGPVDGHAADLQAQQLVTEAVRGMFTSDTVEDVVAVLLDTVHQLGGRAVPADVADEPALPINLAVTGGRPLLVTPDPTVTGSAARLRAQVPRLVEDARSAITRLERHPTPSMPSLPPRPDRGIGRAHERPHADLLPTPVDDLLTDRR